MARGQQGQGGGKQRKSRNPRRVQKYKVSQPPRVAARKDRNVFESSHGKFKNVADLEVHRISITATNKKRSKE